jgi:toxin ParE1/3/4
MEYRVSVTPRADRDWEGIYRRISEDNPEAAHRFCGELLQQARALKTFPHRAESLLHHGQVRKIPYKSYVIFFQINEETRTVEILRFWHGARDQRRLRLKEETVTYAGAESEPAMEESKFASPA